MQEGGASAQLPWRNRNPKEIEMTILNLVIMLAAFCAVIALFNGIVSMAHGGDEDQNQSHKLMFTRVGW